MFPENDETIVDDAPEPIEAVEAEATPEVEEEQKAEEASDSSTDTDAQKGVEKRIDKLTKKVKSAERDAAYWRDQAMKKQPEAPTKEAEPEPIKTLEDFEYDEAKYQQHLFEQARKGAVTEAKTVLQQEREQELASKRASAFNDRLEKFAEKVEDFNEVVRNESLSITQVMADTAADMETGPEVLYYLGKNPDIAQEISRLPPLAAAREMGRIEASLEAKAEKVSKAPAPAPKVAATGHKVEKDPSKMTDSEFAKWRRKQIANRR